MDYKACGKSEGRGIFFFICLNQISEWKKDRH